MHAALGYGLVVKLQHPIAHISHIGVMANETEGHLVPYLRTVLT